MADTSKIAANLQRFQMALNAHDRQNPSHSAWGIGMHQFDLDRLGFDHGEEILPGIVIQADSGVTGNFRILCDGEHDHNQQSSQEAESLDAVSRIAVPVGH